MTAKAKPEEKRCAGCDKVLPCGFSGYEAGYVRFPNGDERYVCEGRTHQSASEVCRKKAIARAKMCPGCGHEGETEPGFVCGECRRALDTAKAFVPKDVRWYVLDYRAWIPSTYGSQGWEVQKDLGLDLNAHETVIRAFVDAIAAGQIAHRKHALDWSERSQVEPIVPEGYKQHFTEMDGPTFQATEEQANAIQVCLEIMSRILREQRLTGRREGRSLLAGLAAGELSPNDWDEQVKNQEEKT